MCCCCDSSVLSGGRLEGVGEGRRISSGRVKSGGPSAVQTKIGAMVTKDTTGFVDYVLKARFQVSYLRKYSKKYLRPRLVSMAPPAESLRASFSKGWAESCKARVCGRSYDPNDFRTGLLSGSIDVYGRSQGPKLWSLAGLRQKV